MHAISNIRPVPGESKTYVTYGVHQNNIGTVSESFQARNSSLPILTFPFAVKVESVYCEVFIDNVT
jgi:hypothetical protein